MRGPAFTLGPWRAEGWENLVVNAADGATLSLAAGPRGAELAELKANAALIAAAPELLACVRAFCENHTVPCGCENCRIIAKAMGKA
jgi:hypothetical protein